MPQEIALATLLLGIALIGIGSQIKKKSDTRKVLLGIGGVLVLLPILGTFMALPTFSLTEVPTDKVEVHKYSYVGHLVKHVVKFEDALTGTSLNGTLYLFESKPESWENERAIDLSDADRTYTVTSGSVTIEEEPGTYYAVAVVDGYYYEFTTVTVPSGGEVPLSDYNQEPAIQKIKLYAKDTALGIADIDLGVSTNETNKEIVKYQYYTVDQDKMFKFWKLVAKVGDVDFTADSDSDGISDEGVKKIVIELATPSQTFKKTIYDSAKGIDLLGSDNEVDLDIDDMEAKDGETVTLKITVVADVQDTTAVTGDEKLENGENILDLIIFDDSGTAQTTINVIG